jgi:tetraacyldisaccharide 4'-kinase
MAEKQKRRGNPHIGCLIPNFCACGNRMKPSLKTPHFWGSKNWLSSLLLPFSYCYYSGYRLRCKYTRPVKLSAPVICIGNLTAGGAGKTPVALYIGQLLKNKNINAFFISRGYGGSQKTALLVDPKKHNALQVGDEPLLLARVLPTIVGKNRLEAAMLAITEGAELLVMDDGFQNPSIEKDLSFIVVDRRLSFGNERMLPAGPLREPVLYGIRRADALIIVNPANFLPTALPDIPFLLARSQPKPSMLALGGKDILAFCGIATPGKFYKMLENSGARIVERISFPDHYHYTRKDLLFLRGQAKKQGNALLVTTSKDATRLPAESMQEIAVAEMELVFENPEKLSNMIEAVINAGKNKT